MSLLDYIFDIYKLISLTYLTELSILLFAIFSFFSLFKFLIKPEGKKIQNTHEYEVPRIGGLFIYIIFFIYFYFFDKQIKNTFPVIEILFFITPIITITIIEDFFFDTNPYIRAIVMLSTSFITIIIISPVFPHIDLPVLSNLLQNRFLELFFYSLCLTGIMNGANFIDGANGLFSLTILSSLSSCIYLTYVVADFNSGAMLLILLTFIIIFLIFNFPFGKIFIGDLGVYFIAFFIGIWLIIFFGKNQDLSPWNAVLVLFYPAVEFLYSITRKTLSKKSPLKPDRFHLHIKIFDIFLNSEINPKYANNLTTIMMVTICFLPQLFIPLIHDKPYAIKFLILFFLLIYLTLANKLPNLKTN